MATIRKTPSATWKAVIRKRGWQAVIKTFRTKRDATDWARRTEDEMVRGVYIDRAASERLLLKKTLDRYETEVCATKRPSTARRERPGRAGGLSPVSPAIEAVADAQLDSLPQESDPVLL